MLFQQNQPELIIRTHQNNDAPIKVHLHNRLIGSRKVTWTTYSVTVATDKSSVGTSVQRYIPVHNVIVNRGRLPARWLLHI